MGVLIYDIRMTGYPMVRTLDLTHTYIKSMPGRL